MIRRMLQEHGFAPSALALVLAVVILALGGVSIDLWRVIVAHQRLVAVTDAAAAAGSGAVDVAQLYVDPTGEPVLDAREATELACRYLIRELSLTGCPSADARVVVEPGSIVVEARSRVPLSLLRLLLVPAGGGDDVEVAVRATAVPIRLNTMER